MADMHNSLSLGSNLGSINVEGEYCPILEVVYNYNTPSYYGNIPSTTAELKIMIPSGRCLAFHGSVIDKDNKIEKDEIKMLKNFLIYKGLTEEAYAKFKSTYKKLENL